MQCNKNIPELRFPEFEGEWDNYCLEDICSFSKGKGISKKNIGKEGIDCICYGELYTVYSEVINKTISKTDLSYEDLILSKKNDVIIPSTGETAIDISQTSCITKDNVAIGGDINILKSKENGIFLSYSLNNNKKNIAKLAQGSTIIHLYADQLKKLIINVPSMDEQEKISNFINILTRKIELMEKKHTLYQNIKKYYSHVLFSNTSDWNKKNLKDIAIIKMGFTPSTKKEEYWNGNIKWLAVSDMGSKYISKTKKHITKIAIGKKEIIKKDTLVMSFKLTIGKLGILKEDMYSNEAICNFQWKNKNINTEFMYYYLSSINLKKYGSQAAKGITLNKETLNMIPIRIPSYETQINIVNILSNIDIKLEYLSKKINYEKRYKKGLLQKMFV